MSRLALTFACGPYDRTEALREGIVDVEGIDLNYLSIQAPREIFDRMVGALEFDLSELSASEFISLTGNGKCPFVALPVFPSRVFRHSFMFVNTKAGIASPKDLEGKRVGVPLYTQTAAIWARGHLAHQYGVDLSKIQWVQGAVEKSGTHGTPHALPLLKPVPIEQNKSEKSLGEMLADGEIAALIGSRSPEVRSANIGRLFPNYKDIERELYIKHKIFPIMHLVAIKRDVYEKNPWIATSLYKAFVDAKQWAIKRYHFSAATSTMFPWHFDNVEEIDDIFGGDAWPYGVEPNRPTLEAFVQMMVEQHFIPKSLKVDDLFVPIPALMGA
jgi:4,5-dihydroxyphthalate decarboxylase